MKNWNFISNIFLFETELDMNTEHSREFNHICAWITKQSSGTAQGQASKESEGCLNTESF